MRQFFFGLGLATGGGLIYFIYLNPEIGYVILAGAVFLAGGALVGGAVLLVNRQWTRAVGGWTAPGVQRNSYNFRPRMDGFGEPPPLRLRDPWADVQVIEAPSGEEGPVA